MNTVSKEFWLRVQNIKVKLGKDKQYQWYLYSEKFIFLTNHLKSWFMQVWSEWD